MSWNEVLASEERELKHFHGVIQFVPNAIGESDDIRWRMTWI